MTHQQSKTEFHTMPATNAQASIVPADHMNPRTIQLDTLLNRSRFIWDRHHSQQASNNN